MHVTTFLADTLQFTVIEGDNSLRHPEQFPAHMKTQRLFSPVGVW